MNFDEETYKIFSEEEAITKINIDCSIILKKLNLVFQRNDLSYFAYGELLLHCIYYHDFYPVQTIPSYKIGMIRADFEKAKAVITDDIFNKRYFVQGIIDELGNSGRSIQIGRHMTYYSIVNGQKVFKNNFVEIEICPFDYIPNDLNKSRALICKMKNLNTDYQCALEGNKNYSGRLPQKEVERYQKKTDILACLMPKVGYCILKEQLYPLKKIKFSTFMLPVPRNITIWGNNFNPLQATYKEKDFIKCAMDKQVNVLRWFNKFAVNNNLDYFAYADLLVEAEYYHNFFDAGKIRNYKIGMLRDHFENMKKIIKDMKTFFGYDIFDKADESNLPSRSIKIGTRVNMISERDKKVQFHNLFIGIEIDPFDNIPDAYEQARFYFWQMRKINALYKKNVKYQNSKINGRLINYSAFSAFFYSFSGNFIMDMVIKYATKFDGKTKTVACVTPKRSKSILLTQIFPLKKCKFNDFEILVPHDGSSWFKPFDSKIAFRTKSIQKVSLEILKKIDKVCTTLNIGYFICGGSMLGAIRHGGFIPWDDDIDIGMLRKDYDIFITKGQKLLGDSVFLQTRQTDSEIPYLFSKVRANNTLYVTNYNEYRHFHKGICVDIFPFDNIPDDPFQQDVFRKEVLKWSKFHNRVVNKQKPENYFETPTNSFFERFIHMINKLHRKLYCMIPLWLTQRLYVRKASSFNALDDLKYVASFVPSYTYIKKEDLLPYKRINFSGFSALAPNKPEVFLEMQYGNYMELPPPHKRMGHDLIDWSVDTTKGKGGN